MCLGFEFHSIMAQNITNVSYIVLQKCPKEGLNFFKTRPVDASTKSRRRVYPRQKLAKLQVISAFSCHLRTRLRTRPFTPEPQKNPRITSKRLRHLATYNMYPIQLKMYKSRPISSLGRDSEDVENLCSESVASFVNLLPILRLHSAFGHGLAN